MAATDKGVPGSESRTGPRLVGCRQRLEKKKNGRHQKICPLRPIWPLIIMQVQLYTTWDSRAHKKCEWRVKYIINITPNWSTWFVPLPSGSDNGSLSLSQPSLQPNVSGISEGLRRMEVEPSERKKEKTGICNWWSSYMCLQGNRWPTIWQCHTLQTNRLWIKMGKLLLI